MKKVEIGQKAKVEIDWTVTTYPTKEEQNAVRSKFAEKYGIPEGGINVVVVYPESKKDETPNTEITKNIQDPKFQEDLFKKYLEQNGIEDYDFNAILKIDSTVNEKIDYNSYEKGKRYEVKWIEWSNFLSYGPNNYFDFTGLKGLVLLNGEPANKSGKSTFAYDLLHFLLFGETKSGKAKTLAQLFNNFLPSETEAVVKGCIHIDDADYIIKRTLTRSVRSKKAVKTASQKVEYYKVIEGDKLQELPDTENLQESSSKETSKVIKEAIGNEKDFDLIISANMKDLDDLISLTEDQRGKLLSRWIGLSVLEDKDAAAREMWNKQISTERYCNIYNREALKAEIETLKVENEENEKVMAETNAEIERNTATIKNFTDSKELALSSKRPVNVEILKAGDLNTLEERKKALTEEGQRKKTQSVALEDELKVYLDVDYSEEEYKTLQREKESNIENLAILRNEIKTLKHTNEDLRTKEYCPTCHRKYDNVDNTEIIKANEAKIEEITKQGIALSKRTDEEIVPKMEEIEQKRELSTKKNKLELQLSALKTNIESLRNSYREVCASINERKENEEAIKFNDALDAKILAINESIRTEERLRQENQNKVLKLSDIIARNKAQISEKASIMAKIDEEVKVEKDWKLYLKMIGKDGIRKMVLNSALPNINAELDKLLDGVSDFKVEVSMNDKKEVEFWLIRDGVRTMLSAASGLERTQAALALRVVLGNMSRLSRPPFILLDEILGATANCNLDAMKKLYDRITHYYTFILHITHLEQIDSWHKTVVTVQKIDNISSIKSVESN